MNLNESELEQELRQLRPRAASRELEERVANVLGAREIALVPRVPAGAVIRRGQAPQDSPLRWWQGLGWALAGVVATLSLFAVIRGGLPIDRAKDVVPVAAMPADEFEHTESTEALITTEDEGLVLDSDQEPVRQVHYYTIERHVWTNAQTGARMEMEVPREDVRLMPVAMQ